jgi:hypothetical protein
MAKWNKENIQSLLATNDRAVERAIVRIYNNQTVSEKSAGNTIHHNGVGFSGAHARRGSYYAKWILRGRRLTRHHLDNARRIAMKYWRQLAEHANS